MTHSFNRTILREYDVRGIVGQTLIVEDAYALGRSYAALAMSEGAKRVAVGRDGRTHSPELEAALVRGLTEGGLDVVRIGMGPSPMLYFAVSTLDVDGGVQVTGSHNPADYNGFKMLLNGRSVFGAEIQDLGRRAAEGDWSEGQGKVEETDIVDAYVDALVKGFDGKAYRIGWDAGNGAGGPILDKLVKRLPGEHHTLYTEVDGRFPNHHPDPTVEANLADLKKLVADKDLDFGIAFDGDADRIGAVDAKGRVIWGDQLLIILAGAGAEGAARRDDHRRRQGQPDPVRPHRRDGRQAADVEDRTQPDQVEDEGNRRAAGRRDERPHLLQASMVRFRRRALRRGAADPRRLGQRQVADRAQGRDAGVGGDARASLPGRRGRKFAVIGEVADAARGRRRRGQIRPTASGSRPPTAGGCCAPPTPRTCSSPAPRRRTRPGSTGSMATVNEQLEKAGSRRSKRSH